MELGLSRAPHISLQLIRREVKKFGRTQVFSTYLGFSLFSVEVEETSKASLSRLDPESFFFPRVAMQRHQVRHYFVTPQQGNPH